MSPTTASATADRDPDLILARAHLRLGSLGLARAELETMAGRDQLDDDGIRDLAEARWRTGDTAGAGEAAAAYLELAPDDIVALVISAEAQSDLGRPAEARRLAGKAMELAEGSLDPVFAGMRRSSVWPIEAGVTVGPVGVLFDDLHPEPVRPAVGFDRRAGDRPASSQPASPHAPLDPGIPPDLEGAQRLWDDEVGPAAGRDGLGVDAQTLFHRARTALDEDQPATAAAGLILALRASPDLAPAVLDLLTGRGEPILVLVRGDAHRIVGREAESLRDHATAARRVADVVVPPAAGARRSDDPASSETERTSDEPPSQPAQEDS